MEAGEASGKEAGHGESVQKGWKVRQAESVRLGSMLGSKRVGACFGALPAPLVFL